MILPIRTSIRPQRMPYTNYGLIVVNVLIFLATYSFNTGNLRPFARAWMLTPSYPYLWQFVTYAFLHAGVWHIFGNMFFLYIFGNNVNDRLGHIGYLCLYLAGGVFSAVGHIVAASLYGSGPASAVLGASGAVSTIVGAYMVLFPQTYVTVVFWFFFIFTFEVPAMFLIIFKMIIIDNILARSTANVAYDAHLAGYVFGIGASLIILALKLIEPDHFDLWSIIRQWRRRREYASVVNEGFDPFSGRFSKKIQVKEIKKTPEQKRTEERTALIRAEIMSRLTQSNLSAACDLYLELRQITPDALLPKQAQLDIANQLMTMGKWDEAANAYQSFLTHYKSYEHIEQIQLMLGIIYSRYLKDSHKAFKYLDEAKSKLTDPGQKKMCSDELARLKG